MTHDALTPDVHHDPDARRLHTRVEGHEAELRYSLRDGRMVIDHTGVPDAIGGRGIAGILVKAALDLARARGWRVVPACSYSAAYVQRHPEYADLIEG
ncbi:MAG: GNAT family N-acetyltransferase [Pseudoxanthomonas sp.]|jgi:predicted GNAT family acetyltransferase|uniref:N-acetyltransferase n=1 Tax=Pseudoxanthomonas mexicana TaxID=128785 RepID=A0ABX6RDH2_PSEMX|nr:GNAT family N-acetyltransferase [Pseudoxanthomonas mexicana]MBP7598552.1 N-acetyltransferase [Pseudoxanthomonas sp.]MDZ4046775.1 GNAT family N-acetyltransferase [Pseudoxanthomonas sp.]QLQ29387.1 MAG: N-acetyltransferase [Pseudoxanthomonas sp.]QND80790.1 N-acetyltransferase [Pseudoxanthomonas mexicana]UOV01553.1 N-acetyltransferase [Pseudoxanthomonas mexicana]